jgi:hypothetical protein
MADLGFQFNANDYEAPSFEPVPKGEYPMMVIESSVDTNSAQTGRNLKLVLEIISGQYKGRKIYESLSIENPSEMAVKIARGTLSAIGHAVGVLEIRDSTVLHNRPFLGKLRIQKGRDGYDDSNSLANAKALDGSNVSGGAGTSSNQGGFQGFGEQQQGNQQQGNQGGYGQYGNNQQQNNSGFNQQQNNQQQNTQQGNQNGFNQNGQQGFSQGGYVDQNQNGFNQNQNGYNQNQNGFNQGNQQQVDTLQVADMQFNGQQQQNQQQNNHQQQIENAINIGGAQNQSDLPPWERK